jgi:hypothetical protein
MGVHPRWIAVNRTWELCVHNHHDAVQELYIWLAIAFALVRQVRVANSQLSSLEWQVGCTHLLMWPAHTHTHTHTH